MNVLRLKDSSVTLNPIAPAGGAILAALGVAASTLQRDLVIACGTERHPATDPHTLGEAYDVSVMGLSEAQILMLVNTLKRDLGPMFSVLYEVKVKPNGVLASVAYLNPQATAPHLHIQRKKGTTYVPQETP